MILQQNVNLNKLSCCNDDEGRRLNFNFKYSQQYTRNIDFLLTETEENRGFFKRKKDHPLHSAPPYGFQINCQGKFQ